MTKQLIHLSPLGELEIPTVLEPVAPGVPFDVDDDIADRLLEQDELYQLAKPTTIKAARKLAAELGVDVSDLKTRNEILAAIDAADAEEAQQ